MDGGASSPMLPLRINTADAETRVSLKTAFKKLSPLSRSMFLCFSLFARPGVHRAAHTVVMRKIMMAKSWQPRAQATRCSPRGLRATVQLP